MDIATLLIKDPLHLPSQRAVALWLLNAGTVMRQTAQMSETQLVLAEPPSILSIMNSVRFRSDPLKRTAA